MNLYDLGQVPWLESQLIYHAFPRLGMEGLILLAPAEPYVCIGYHQDAEQEVDLDYCREQGIPVFRREVGGGAVYLDGQQLFYQLVIHKDNPLAPRDKAEFYRQLLAPVVETYRGLGVEVHYKPVNDIVTGEGRKISGNGAADIGAYAILVGNLIIDFDYETMVRVLRVPDVKFRDKVFKSLRENLTTLHRELEQVPPWETMITRLVRAFEAVLGPLVPADLPMAVEEKVAELTWVPKAMIQKAARLYALERPGYIRWGNGTNGIQFERQCGDAYTIYIRRTFWPTDFTTSGTTTTAEDNGLVGMDDLILYMALYYGMRFYGHTDQAKTWYGEAKQLLSEAIKEDNRRDKDWELRPGHYMPHQSPVSLGEYWNNPFVGLGRVSYL